MIVEIGWAFAGVSAFTGIAFLARMAYRHPPPDAVRTTTTTLAELERIKRVAEQRIHDEMAVARKGRDSDRGY